MRFLRYRYLILNASLCFLAAVLGFENYQAWNLSAATRAAERTRSAKVHTAQQRSETHVPPPESATRNSFQDISEKNIFSPERKDFPIAPPLMEISKPVVRPQVILYGVAIGDDYESATVSNPGRPLRRGERETVTVKVGDKIGEYKLARILPDRIALEAGGDVFDVLLYDPRHPKKRAEVHLEVKPAPPVAGAQPSSMPSSGEAQKSTSPTAQKAIERPQPQLPPPLPFNKYTFQLGTTAGARGTSVSSPPK